MGFPIRKSTDQSFFAAPHGLSQRSTSFIASQRQGIRRTPLRHLIALIINVHTLGRMYLQAIPKDASCKRTLNEKTSYCFVRSNRWRAVKLANKDRFTTRRSCDRHAPKTIWRYANGARRLLYKTRTRIDLLFTMSENPPGCALRKAGEYKLRTMSHRRCPDDSNEAKPRLR